MLSEIKSLVDFVNKCKVQHLEIFTREDFSEKKSKMGQLFEFIKKTDISDKDSLRKIFNGEHQFGYGFEKLFTRFQEKLSNTLFFIDTRTSLFSERAIAYYNCSRRSYIVRILLERGLRKFAISLVEKTLPISMRFEFTDLSIFFLRTLMRHYSTTNVNLKKYLKFKAYYITNLDMLNKEYVLEVMVNNIAYESNSIKYMSKKMIIESELQEIVQLAKQCLSENPSIDVIIHATKVLHYYFQLNKEYDSFKELTINTILKIKTKPFKSIVTLESLISAQLSISILNKDALTAEFIREKYFNDINIGNFNWYVIHLNYILTMMHSNHYQLAFSTVQFILNFKTFDKQPPVIKENMYILQAYAYFLLKIGKVDKSENYSEFRINKFMNQVPKYSKDKEGSNISIILIQMLLFLADKNYSKFIDRMESLSLYAYRHLKKDVTFRSQSFIRMLSEMVKADFRKKGTKFRTDKLFEKLKTVSIDLYGTSTGYEIIPYEDLWKLVIDQLE